MERPAPTFQISDPVELPSGKFRVEIRVSSEPHLIHRRFGDTAEEADSKAREFREARLASFFKSLARRHKRVAARIAQARNAAHGADMGAEA